MDRQAQALVLENIRSQIANRWQQIVAELRSYGDSDLGEFLEESGLELSDILRRGSHSWTRLRRDAGLPTEAGSEMEEKLLKRVRAFAHVDDRTRARAYRRLLADDAADYESLSESEQRLARMLYYSLWSDGGGHKSLRRRVWKRFVTRVGDTRGEISSVVDLSFEAARHVAVDLGGALAPIPLRVHARYQREEILAALDFPRNPNSFREGVWYSSDTQRRRLLRHAQEVRGRLLPHHDVPRLPDLPDAVPLGVAIDHVDRIPDRAAAISPVRAGCSSLPARSRRTSSAPRRTSSWGQLTTSPTQETGQSRSRGSWSTRCRPTSSRSPRR